MRYNVAQLLKEPTGSTRSYELEEDFTGPQKIADLARGRVHMLRTHLGILVRANLEVQSTLSCGRCLRGFIRSSELLVEEQFYPTVDLQTGRSLSSNATDDEGSLIDSRHLLDLTGAVGQCVVTDIPMKPLCQHDCLGLCHVCGTNQNLESCDCVSSIVDSRWEALAGLVDEESRQV